MIENINDLISVLIIAGIVLYFLYRIIKTIQFQRLTKHIREEQKYYKNWEE